MACDFTFQSFCERLALASMCSGVPSLVVYLLTRSKCVCVCVCSLLPCYPFVSMTNSRMHHLLFDSILILKELKFVIFNEFFGIKMDS